MLAAILAGWTSDPGPVAGTQIFLRVAEAGGAAIVGPSTTRRFEGAFPLVGYRHVLSTSEPVLGLVLPPGTGTLELQRAFAEATSTVAWPS
jgi:hypothetical protein